MAEIEFQQVQDALEVRRLDHPNIGDLQRMREEMQIRPLWCKIERRMKFRSSLSMLRRDRRCVIGDHVECDVAVAESEIEIDEHQRCFRALAAKVAARLTASVVQPTPPRVPSKLMIWAPRCRRRSPAAGRLRSVMTIPLYFSKSDNQVLKHDWLREEVLRASLQCLQNRLIVRTNDQDRQARAIVAILANQVQGLGFVGVQADDSQIRRSFQNDVREELITAAFGFQKNKIHPRAASCVRGVRCYRKGQRSRCGA